MDNNNLDQQIGRILEEWLSRDTGTRCRFCNEEIKEKKEMSEKFCNQICKIAFSEIVRARIVIGTRDLKQRGFD